MAESAEFVIVGAGVMGASIAFHLAERRAGRILVLDQAYVASGASGRSSGLVRMHYTYPPEVHLALLSLDYFIDWQQRLGRPSSFRRTGFLRIVPVSQAARSLAWSEALVGQLYLAILVARLVGMYLTHSASKRE